MRLYLYTFDDGFNYQIAVHARNQGQADRLVEAHWPEIMPSHLEKVEHVRGALAFATGCLVKVVKGVEPRGIHYDV